MPKTILVTGAAGFIGSHTTEALLARGDRVVGVDNFCDYYDPAQKRANVREIHEHHPDAPFQLVEGDIRDRRLLADLFERNHFDAVVHLAAMAGVRASQDNPHLYFDVNLTGTLNLLEEARKHQTDNFVFASTSSVYGRTDQIPFVETDPCDRPLAPYPASKRAAELLGHSYHHLYGLNFTALRFFTVYGPRNRPDMMAYKLMDSAVNDTPVELYNGGEMWRDWTYVEDIARGVVSAADRPLGFEIVNIGRGRPELLADFVSRIETLAGRKPYLLAATMPAADMPRTHANTDRIRDLLAYTPQVSLERGTTSLWSWFAKAIVPRRKPS